MYAFFLLHLMSKMVAYSIFEQYKRKKKSFEIFFLHFKQIYSKNRFNGKEARGCCLCCSITVFQIDIKTKTIFKAKQAKC